MRLESLAFVAILAIAIGYGYFFQPSSDVGAGEIPTVESPVIADEDTTHS